MKKIKFKKYFDSFLGILGLVVLTLFFFFVLFYTYTFISLVFFPTPTPLEALARGELKVTGKVLEISDKYVIFERLYCNVQDCDMLVGKEFRVSREPFDEVLQSNGIYSVATIHITGKSENDSYFESRLQSGLQYSTVFSHNSLDFRPRQWEELILKFIPLVIAGFISVATAITSKLIWGRRNEKI